MELFLDHGRNFALEQGEVEAGDPEGDYIAQADEEVEETPRLDIHA
jgi:hypothetical protein